MKSTTSTSRLRLLSLTAIMIGLCYVLFNESEINPVYSTKDPDQNEKPEAFIEGAKFTLFDDKGNATNLESKEAMFYSHSDRIDINKLQGTLTNESGQIITLTSDTGKIDPSNNTITLIGNVLIEQTYPQKSAWSISGQEFMVDKQQGTITTRQAVTISQNQNTLRAIGLNAWMNEKRIELLSNVRGQYAFN